MPKIHNYNKEQIKSTQKEKLRKAKKGRPNTKSKAPRRKDWNNMANDDWNDLDFDLQDERVMPKGSTERRKETAKIADTVLQPKTISENNSLEAEKADTDLKQGMVIEVSAGMVKVKIKDKTLNCQIRGVLKKEETGYTNIITVGDQVLVRSENMDHVVEKVLPRHSVLSRPDRINPSLHQLVVANVDLVLIVSSWRNPKFWPELIDRYLIAAQRFNLKAVICVNKIDLVEDEQEFKETIKVYQDIGIEILTTSAEKTIGIENLRDQLQNKTSVLAGLSGVGKSSLLSKLDPNLNLRALTVGERGKNRNQGRHTTSMATLYNLPNNSSIIDTPGIRSFGLDGLDKEDLASFYPEMDLLRKDCEYNDCLHLKEPGCAVRAAVLEGKVSSLRYENYEKIIMKL